MADAFHREYLLRLPLSLAQLYSRAYNAKDARGRHDNTFYLFEASIKLMAATLSAAYLDEVAQGQPRVAMLDRLLSHLALPSLGQWVAIVRELSRHFNSRPDAPSHPLGHLWKQLTASRRGDSALLALHRRIKNGIDAQPSADQCCSILDVLHALVQYRNGVCHGGPRFADFYETQMGPLLFPAADELLADGTLDMIGPPGARLVSLMQLRVLDEQQVEISLRELSGLQGERLPPLVLPRDAAQAMSPNVVAVIFPGRKLPLRLDPLLRYRESDLADELLFLNRQPAGKQVEYLSYTTGRMEYDPSMTPAMAALLQRITGASVDERKLQEIAEENAAGAADEACAEIAEPAAPPAHRIVGDYELLARIGSGGMGVVYLARQRSLGRTVALKMLPAEMLADETALARFRREMRWLASCDHPNIVKILSTGQMPDGQLYYAMEYVPGCDLEQVWRELSGGDSAGSISSGALDDRTFAAAVLNASRRQRQEAEKTATGAAAIGDALPTLPPAPQPSLPDPRHGHRVAGGYVRKIATLIRDAALALQAVHDQDVVHRDIKPANLMLTPDGNRVVLMDFGLAKGQGPSLALSRREGFLGTLRYSAPEQQVMQTFKSRIGPAADVRALGVVLWELLTRRRLFADAEDETQLAAMIRDRDVPRLRAIDPSFDADIDAIVARATERRIEDRIPTAALLAQYLGLWLDGKPLPIRPPGAGEMLRRWVRQHKPLVISVGAAVAVIIVATAVAFHLVNHARAEAVRERAVAVEQRAAAKSQADIATAVAGFLKDMLGSADPERLLGDKVTVLQAITAASAELDRGKLANQPLVESSVRTVIGRTFQGLGRYDLAEPHLEKALDILKKTLPPGDPQIAIALNNLGELLWNQNRLDDAEPLMRQALAMQRASLPAAHPQIATSLTNLASLLWNRNRFDEAEPLMREALAIERQSLSADDPEIPIGLNNLALLLQSRGKLAEAEPLLRESLEIRKKTLPPGHPKIATSMSNLAGLLQLQDKLSEAEPLLREALRLSRAALPPAHPDLATSLNNLAGLLQSQNKLSEAEPLLREAMDIYRKSLPPGHPLIATGMNNLAMVLADEDKPADAEPLLRQALEIRRHALPSGHPDLAASLVNLAVALKSQKKLPEAEPLFREALDLAKTTPRISRSLVRRAAAELADLLDATQRRPQADALRKEYAIAPPNVTTRPK